jgi:glutamate-ammonia-ligase adenylyltransferase
MHAIPPESLKPSVALAWNEFSAHWPPNTATDLPAPIRESLDRVWTVSPFVAGQCARRPELLMELIESGRLLAANSSEDYQLHLRHLLENANTETELMRILRYFRHQEMVRIAWRDIAGWASVEETMLDLSILAETCVQESLDWLFRQACGARGTPLNKQGQAQSLVVLGMGKLGADELNFSSDIDLIFAYRDEGVLPDKRETSYVEFYTKLARSLVKALESITEDGFVFRVDTRLRPFGESGPLVLNFYAMETYYQSQAREWERYALIKARVIAGDQQAGQDLLEFLRPFVYRRYLDFRTLGELRELKQKISQELQRRDRQDNIKLGPGGIREIEFIGQAFQLIRGGREKRLQERSIQKVLTTLGDLGLLPPPIVLQLQEAYRFLRTLENRLQQYADQQTHDLPTSPSQRESLAFALDFPDWECFTNHLEKVRHRVHEVFQQVIVMPQFESRETFNLNNDPEQIFTILHGLGWPNPESATALLKPFLSSHAVRRLTTRGTTELGRLMPMLLRVTATTERPQQTLDRLLALIQTIASRNVYLTLLVENPPALTQLVRLAATSPWITQFIALHPLLLDELLDPRTLYAPLSKAELEQELRRKLASLDPNDLEQLLIALRQFKQANVLRVASSDIVGAIPIMIVSDHLTEVAEVLLNEIVRWAWRLTAAKHGVPPGTDDSEPGHFGVIAYGKMGGIELGYGSDLDLVFLYEGLDGAQTSGEKAVTTAEFFARMGKRIIHLLTANTPSGTLYEVDLRLRPSGASGLLVSHVDAYATYQMNKAWTFEQQALVKARFVAGDPKIGTKFQAIRHQSLTRLRDRETLRTEVGEMREKMRENLAVKKSDLFDLKHASGGIVDIEFIVQFGVLSGAHDCPQLTRWTDVVRLLETLANANFLSAEESAFLKQAYCLFRERTHRAALQEIPAWVPVDEYQDQRLGVRQIWRRIMQD